MKQFYVLLGGVLLLGINFSVGDAASNRGAKTRARIPPKIRRATAAKIKTTPVAVWRESGDPVTGLAVSANRVMVTDGSDTVWLYRPDGKLQKTFVPKDADDFRVFTYDAGISPDGKYGLAASVDLGARLLDLEAGKVVTGFGDGMSRLNAVAYSPDGKLIAVATSGSLKVSKAPERSYLSGFSGLEAGAGSVAFSPDGALLAVGGEDKSVRVFKVADGSQSALWQQHEGAVRALAWSRDGKLLASGSRDGSVRVWDIATQKLLTSIAPREGAVESLAWSAGGTILAVAVSPPGGESSARPSEPERNPPGSADAPHPVVQLWVVKGANAVLKRAVRGVFGARKIAFAPDGKLIAGFADGRVAAYDLAAVPTVAPLAASRMAPKPTAPREDAQGIRILTGLAGGAAVVAFSRDGQFVAAGNAEAQIGVWDARNGTFSRRISGHTKGVNSLAWSPDGSLLASGGEDRLQVVRVADDKILWNVAGRAVVAGFAPDGKTVFAFVGVGGSNAPQTLRGWGAIDGSQGAALGRLPYPMRAAISPDGTLIAADQGTSKEYLDSTVLSVFKTLPENPADNAAAAPRTIGSLHGRVNALRWLSASRLLVDEGDYNDGHNDSQKAVPGKLGVRFFNPIAGTESKSLLTFEMPIVALDENARGFLAVAEDRRAVRIFDAKQQEIAAWPLPDNNVRVKSVAWSPDGKVLAIGIEGAPLRLWRVPLILMD